MTLVARKMASTGANGARNGNGGAIEPEPRSLAERAYELLVRKITRLELPPGSVLVDKVLIEELGIGRTPIREAMQRLAIERLVDHLPNRGMLVSEITADGVQQIYEFRAVLDGYAAWLAATRATPEQVRELAAAHKRLVRATEDDDVNEFVEGDRDFYRALSAAAHNSLVADSIPRIFNLHLRLWFYISEKLGGWHALAASHQEMTREIVDALANRDPARARAAMENYVTRRHQDIKKIL
ncbi:MAG TPA: GntR family transcriptional regulator [Usitatibacter sp.]|nr:GntR family transcriptional regulator [Usitatibacter sp.]